MQANNSGGSDAKLVMVGGDATQAAACDANLGCLVGHIQITLRCPLPAVNCISKNTRLVYECMFAKYQTMFSKRVTSSRGTKSPFGARFVGRDTTQKYSTFKKIIESDNLTRLSRRPSPFW
jgi:hypothetical protein